MLKNEKLRIAQIADVSGVTSNLVKGLTAIGHEVVLINPTVNVPHRRAYSKAQIAGNRILDSLRISRQIRRMRYDVVHVHYALMAPLVWPSAYPYYLHCHGSDLINNLHDYRFRAITRLALSMAKGVFYTTPDLKEYLREDRPDAVFLPNPIDTTQFSPAASKGAGRKRPIVFVVSRLAIKKGVDIAMDGLKEARKSHDFDIMFWDNGVDSASMMPRIREQFPDAAILPEGNQSTVLENLRRSDIVLGQLRAGALGMSELEAMSCGKPVIGSFRFPGAYETAPPIVEAKDAGEISNAISALITRAGSMESIGRSAREWILANHDMVKVAGRLAGYYGRA